MEEYFRELPPVLGLCLKLAPLFLVLSLTALHLRRRDPLVGLGPVRLPVEPRPEAPRPMRVYVASSWRNTRYRAVTAALLEAGFEVLDWRDPDTAFHWSQLAPGWERVNWRSFRELLNHPRACHAFLRDFRLMGEADACLLLLPCGRSAHLEAGWFLGRRLPTVILGEDDARPELMYGMATLADSVEEAITCLRAVGGPAPTWERAGVEGEAAG